jgi:hypothetical protein
MCSEDFTGTDGSAFTDFTVLDHTYNTGVQPTIQNNTLQLTSASRHDYTTTFQFNGEFDVYLTFEIITSKIPSGIGNWVYLSSSSGDAYISYTFGDTYSPTNIYYDADIWDGGSNYTYTTVNNTDTIGRLRIRRAANNNIYMYYWNQALSRWEWNGDTNGGLAENYVGSYGIYFDCMLSDGSIVQIGEFITTDGCDDLFMPT